MAAQTNVVEMAESQVAPDAPTPVRRGQLDWQSMPGRIDVGVCPRLSLRARLVLAGLAVASCAFWTLAGYAIGILWQTMWAAMAHR